MELPEAIRTVAWAWAAGDPDTKSRIISRVWEEVGTAPNVWQPGQPDPDPDPDPGTPAGGVTLSAISQYGITWRFSGDVTAGRYATGDWWVLGPCTVAEISPGTVGGTRHMNGSMVNPRPGAYQGFDSSCAMPYSQELNVGLQLPLQLKPGTSLVSSITYPEPKRRPQLRAAAVLTCLDAPPPAGSLRPPYSGSDKRSPGLASWITPESLPAFPGAPGRPTALAIAGDGTPDLLVPAERAVARPWLDFGKDWIGREIHPSENMPAYGAEISDTGGTAALLSLCEDVPWEERYQIAIGLCQIGIDLAGMLFAGADPWHWSTGGAHGSGRLGPILYAGEILHSSSLRGIRQSKPAQNYNELGQTFVVGEEHFPYGYGPEHLGLDEWGNQANRTSGAWQSDPRWAVPQTDPKWQHLRYRTSDTARSWWGWLTALELLGLKGAVEHDAWWGYQERYRAIQVEDPAAKQQTKATQPWSLAMWDLHHR